MHHTRRVLRFSIPALLLGCTAALASAASPTPAALANITIDNFGVVSQTYYRGAQPRGGDYDDLAALGVKTVIDLTKDGDSGERRAVEAAGMQFYRIPMTTSDRPDARAVEQFLALVNAPANQPVYVHCQGGRHRTGTLTAVYRMTHDGWTADRAFAEMNTFDFGSGFGHGALKSFVFDFYRQLGQSRTVVATTGTR